MPTRSGGIGRRLPSTHRPHSSATRRRHHREPKLHAEIFTLWAKVHSHACRGASRRSCPLILSDKANALCVHVLFRFVNAERGGELGTGLPRRYAARNDVQLHGHCERSEAIQLTVSYEHCRVPRQGSPERSRRAQHEREWAVGWIAEPQANQSRSDILSVGEEGEARRDMLD
jgi:hypothetical protein